MADPQDLQEDIFKRGEFSKSSWKNLAAFGSILIFVILLFSIYVLKANPVSLLSSKVRNVISPPTSKVVEKGDLTKILNDQHAKSFYAELEYDPATGKVLEHYAGISNGDIDPLSSSPEISSVIFNFRIEVLSDKNELVFSGWNNLFKRVITTPEKKYSFSVYAPYYHNATVSVFDIDNHKLWQSKIP